MTQIDEKIRDYFTSDGIVSNTVGDRVFGGESPQDAALPFVRYTWVSNRFLTQHDGTDNWREPSLQLDCVAKTRNQAISLAGDVIDSSSKLRDDQGVEAVNLQNVRDNLRDEDTNGWQVQVDLAIQHDERISTST